MTGFAVPILFVSGAQVACQHADGLRVHQWQRVVLGQTLVAMVVCSAQLRVYVHEGDRDVIERWSVERPGRLIALAEDWAKG